MPCSLMNIVKNILILAPGWSEIIVNIKRLRIYTNNAKQKKEEKEIEKKYGIKYSVMNELPYFDCVGLHTIDPMHNLLLGISKLMMKTWKEIGYLKDTTFKEMQEEVNAFTLPQFVGRIPRKIGSQFMGFTADQWRSRTTIFSLPVMKLKLPENDYNCWAYFVLACCMLCTKTISEEEVAQAHVLLLRFLECYLKLYKEERLVPNLHPMLHLKECMLMFGPTYSIWLFSFERMNGLLGSIPTNNKYIEEQFFCRFLLTQRIIWKKETFETKTIAEDDKESISGTLLDTNQPENSRSEIIMTAWEEHGIQSLVNQENLAKHLKLCLQIPIVVDHQEKHLQFYTLEEKERQDIIKTMGEGYSRIIVAQEIREITIGNNSFSPLSDRKSWVLAFKKKNGKGDYEIEASLGQIVKILKVTLETEDSTAKSFFLIHLLWFQRHPNKYYLPSPCGLWNSTTDSNSFIPIQFIICPTAIKTIQR